MEHILDECLDYLLDGLHSGSLTDTEFALSHKQELHVLVLAYQCIVQKHKESKR